MDDQYSALIPKWDAQGKYTVGQVLRLRVTEVKEDGKLTVSAKQKAYLQMNEDVKLILQSMEKSGGRLGFDDKASPEDQPGAGNFQGGVQACSWTPAEGKKIQIEGGQIILKQKDEE